jgi:hypothetical protein
LRNIAFSGHPDHDLNFGYFSANADTSFTPHIKLIASTGNVGIGTTDSKALLHVRGKSIIDSRKGATPANGLYGSDGTRLILWPGAPDNVPYSFGISATTLWYSVPTGAIHAFYIGTTERISLDASGKLSCSTLNINGSNSSNYLFHSTGLNHESIQDFNNVGKLAEAARSAAAVLLAPADACGVCGGNGSACAGCDGVPHSGAALDRCGVGQMPVPPRMARRRRDGDSSRARAVDKALAERPLPTPFLHLCRKWGNRLLIIRFP